MKFPNLNVEGGGQAETLLLHPSSANSRHCLNLPEIIGRREKLV